MKDKESIVNKRRQLYIQMLKEKNLELKPSSKDKSKVFVMNIYNVKSNWL